MKMDAYAWRNDSNSYEYKIQVNDIKHGDKTTFSKLFKEWQENGYGWNIKKGECHEKKIITQIAPTLSQKLKITLPNATESEVLNEILEK